MTHGLHTYIQITNKASNGENKFVLFILSADFNSKRDQDCGR